MVVTFCGHATVEDPANVRRWLTVSVEELIRRGADMFYLGGYGAFDLMAAGVVWELKKSSPHVCSYLVLPYPDRKVDAGRYDGTVYPPLETVPMRFAISKRNEFMVDWSEVVVAYVLYGWGGAAQTLRYAERRGKEIITYTPAALEQEAENPK